MGRALWHSARGLWIAMRKEGKLLQLDLGASLFQLLLQLLGLVLGHAFLDGLGSGLNDSLGVSQAQAGDLTDGLDDLDLLVAEAGQNSVFSAAASAAGAAAAATATGAAAETPNSSSRA